MNKKIVKPAIAITAIVTGSLLLFSYFVKHNSSCNGNCNGCSACKSKGPANSQFYVEKKEELVKDFASRQKVFEKELRKHYSQDEIEKIKTETEARFNELIPQIPYIGGDQNPRTEDIEQAAMVLAFYRVQKQHGRTTEQIGSIITSSIQNELKRYPRWLLYLNGAKFFSQKTRDIEKSNAVNTQKKLYPFDWVTYYVGGDGVSFDYGCDHLECGIVKYLGAQGASDIVPYLCRLDFVYSDAFGEGLHRTGTIAEGAKLCDFRFKREKFRY